MGKSRFLNGDMAEDEKPACECNMCGDVSMCEDVRFVWVLLLYKRCNSFGQYVNAMELIDVVGVVQSVSLVLSIRRKSNNEEITKYYTSTTNANKKKVILSLWNDLVKKEGLEILDMESWACEWCLFEEESNRMVKVKLALLQESNKDHLIVNPMGPLAQSLLGLKLLKILVAIANGDLMLATQMFFELEHHRIDRAKTEECGFISEFAPLKIVREGVQSTISFY